MRIIHLREEPQQVLANKYLCSEILQFDIFIKCATFLVTLVGTGDYIVMPMLLNRWNRSSMDDNSLTSDSTYSPESPDSSCGSPLSVTSSVNSLDGLTTIPLRRCAKRLRTSTPSNKSDMDVKNRVASFNNYEKLCRTESPKDFAVDRDNIRSTPRTVAKSSSDTTSSYPLLKRALERPALIENGYYRLNPYLTNETPEYDGPDSATSNNQKRVCRSRSDNNEITTFPLIKSALERPPLIEPQALLEDTFRCHYKKAMLSRISGLDRMNVNAPLDLSSKKRV